MPASEPNWNDLRIFLEVYRRGSLSAAARQLHIDVSTVSRHIASLEKSLNGPVFERQPSGLKVTPLGMGILASVETMESHSLALMQAVRDTSGELAAGRVRIATMEGIGSFYLAERTVQFNTVYPNISIDLITSSHQVHVSRREADLFLSFYPYEAKSLDILPVGKFHLYLYASQSYLDKKGYPTDKEALSEHCFVSYIEEMIELDTVRWLQEVLENPSIIFSSTSMVAQMFAAASGAGIVMLPEFMKAERLGLQRVLANEVMAQRVVWLSVHSELRYLPKMKAVINFLIDAFQHDYPNVPGIVLK